MLAAMKVAVLCVVALAGAVKAGSGSGSSGSGSDLEPAAGEAGEAGETGAAATTAPFTTATDTNATMKADYTHPDNATTAPADITTAGFTAPPDANETTAPSHITTAGQDAGNATAATVADADTTTAAATTAAAATAGTTVAPKEIAVKENRQSAKFAVSMGKDECNTLQKSPEDVKKTTEAVAAAAKVDASKLDFGASKSKCVDPARRQRRAAVNLEVTLVFKKDVSAADVAAAVTAANELIKAGGFEVTVTIGGVSKTIAVTQTVTQATEVVTVMVPNPDYVAAVTTAADTTAADADTTAAADTNATEPASTAAAGNGTTAQPGTTTNAVVNTPKASASLARGSALLVAALAASHALLA